jgi:hypothetical protein
VDKKILEDSGRMVMAGFGRGMASEVGSIKKQLAGLTADLPTFATNGRTRGGDGASTTSPTGGGRTVNVTLAPGAIVIQGGGTKAGEDAAEALLEALATAQG